MPWFKHASFRYCVPSLLALVTFTIQASSQQLITFDAPNAGTLPGTGTEPTGINALGTITGVVFNNGFGWHGFVLGGGSEPMSFDAPGADPTAPGGTSPTAINDSGEIVGYFADSNQRYHGFLRRPNGKFTVFDAPGNALYIFPFSINNFDVVTGWYFDALGLSHAFYLTHNGKVTAFADGAFGYSINNLGIISGVQTITPSDSFHVQGFLRTHKGMINFKVPGAIGSGLSNAFINDFGVVAGTYPAQQATDHAVGAGFLRAPNGTFTVFASPSGSLKNLEVDALNNYATTTGFFEDALTSTDHAFVRYADGNLIAISMPAGELESVGTAINSRGVVAGWWLDSAGLFHGYTWKNQ